jgi:hypothetical protein
MRGLNNLTEDEKLALGDLLSLVTHDEAVNRAVLGNYATFRSGNREALPSSAFAAALDSLYVRTCR